MRHRPQNCKCCCCGLSLCALRCLPLLQRLAARRRRRRSILCTATFPLGNLFRRVPSSSLSLCAQQWNKEGARTAPLLLLGESRYDKKSAKRERERSRIAFSQTSPNSFSAAEIMECETRTTRRGGSPTPKQQKLASAVFGETAKQCFAYDNDPRTPQPSACA